MTPRADRRIGPENRRLALSLLISLLAHLPLLSLTFGGDGSGLPGFGFPWQVRRIEVPDLRVFLVPGRASVAEPAVVPFAEPLPLPRVEQPVAARELPSPSSSAAAPPKQAALAIVQERQVDSKTDFVAVETPAETPLPVEPPAEVKRTPIPEPATIPEPAVIAVERSEEAPRVVATPPAPVVVEAPSVTIPEMAKPPIPDAAEAERARVDREARERAADEARLERARQEARRQAEQEVAERNEVARQETVRQEVARQEAARQEAARQEAARQEAARQEAARQEAARQEAARQEAARQESARQEAARQEAARQEAARQEAAWQESARLEAARQQAERQAAARQEAARVQAAQEAESRREAVLRVIGRQLDEEAARREAASSGARLPLSVGSARRGRLFGRFDSNAELVKYGEDWGRKIQMNMTFDMVREAAKLPHTNPVVTVAVRKDGSVESVTFVVSSGVPALDEAIRRVVRSQEHYPAFPPGLALDYDVIEIRRTWYFDMAIRLH